ncbi:MAG TPA: 1-acyl-sn-glycerol-3-phosphate acyltransferase, partial [Candidatus Hydrogenedentes bacterium]|nr:1-acyl-sn-glycerol-3-phosphate acyltransferase [Candidatus Hydrogenedentota bacterium]
VVVGMLLFLPGLLAFKVIARWPADKTARWMIWIYAKVWIAIASPFVRLKRENLSRRTFPEYGIMVMNHLSFFDAYFLGALPVFDATIAIRAWPFRMPWYAPVMRCAGYINIEQAPWEQIERTAREVALEKRYIVMFPEGHRSRNGRLGRFHSGAFKLARETQMPIIPLCISGTGRLLPPGRRWMAPAEVRFRLLPVVHPSQFPGELGHVAMRKHVKAMMADALSEMRQELGA